VYKNDVYGEAFGASALAADNVVRYAFSIAVPLFTVPMVNHLGFKWAIAIFAFITLVFVPLPLWLYMKGQKLRGRSLYVKALKGIVDKRISWLALTPLSNTDGGDEEQKSQNPSLEEGSQLTTVENPTEWR
jgi:hypothetical protein